MSANDVLVVIKTRWRILVATTLIVFVVAVIVTLVTPKSYQSTATLYIAAVEPPNSNGQAIYQGSLISEQRTRSYAQLMTSYRLASEVVDQLKLNETPDDLLSRVSAGSQENTVLITVSATDQTPQRAAEIANAFAGRFILLVNEIERPVTPFGSPDVAARVAAVAPVPVDAVAPRPKANLVLGLVAGLLLGVLAALLQNYRDRSLRSPEKLSAVAGVPNLALIPRVSDEATRDGNDVLAAARLEAMRKLRTNIQFIRPQEPRKSIVVTSPVPGEGKTTTVLNLADAMASTGQRVVVVDADLRRPTVGERLGLDTSVGVTSVLIRKVDLAQAIQTRGRGKYDVLLSGQVPPNPSELVSSQEMVKLIGRLKETYDAVLVDSPPVLPVADAAALAALADATILVFGFGNDWDSAEKAMAVLNGVEAHVFGTVLNQCPREIIDERNLYGHYYVDGQQSAVHRADDSKTSEIPSRERPALRKSDSAPSPHRRSV